jgi:hypothetical protein
MTIDSKVVKAKLSRKAILQGDNLRAIKQRNIQRIFGTTIGLVISAFLLNNYDE